MGTKTEGTFYLDGLIEGCFSAEEDEQRIRRFVDEIRRDGFDFYLKIERNHFSLLPRQQSCKKKQFDLSVDRFLEGRLEKLFEEYSCRDFKKFMSTLRSVEYLDGFETQAVYGIDTDGQIVVEKRTIPAATVPSQKPLSLKQKVQGYGVMALVLLAAIAISSLFVPYKKMAGSLWSSIRPYDVKEVQVSFDAYSSLVEPQEIGFSKDKSHLVIAFLIKPGFPLTKEGLNAEWIQSAENMEKRLVLESIARNTLRCNLFDQNGEHYAVYSCSLIWNEQRSGFTLRIPFSRTLGRIEITY